MSQLLLDEQVNVPRVLAALRKWITVDVLPALRPGERVLDDRIPTLLRTLKRPTFVTIDSDFWHRRLCHPDYCILYFYLRDDQQPLIPDLLRALLRHPEFHTRAARMGKVACISTESVDYWQFQVAEMQHLEPPRPRRRRR
jgi:hypothetical protein